MSIDRVRVKRLDNGREVVVPISEVLYWLKHDKYSASFAVMRRKPLRGDAPYLRPHPGARYCVRVEILERLEGGSGADPDGGEPRQAGATPLDPPPPPTRALGTIIDPELEADPEPVPPAPPSRLALAFRRVLGAEVRP